MCLCVCLQDIIHSVDNALSPFGFFNLPRCLISSSWKYLWQLFYKIEILFCISLISLHYLNYILKQKTNDLDGNNMTNIWYVISLLSWLMLTNYSRCDWMCAITPYPNTEGIRKHNSLCQILFSRHISFLFSVTETKPWSIWYFYLKKRL